jgi:hypothetical protein
MAPSAALDAQRLSNDKPQVARLLDILPSVPPLTWGRDKLRSGDLWNPNSLNLGCLARDWRSLPRVYYTSFREN